MNHYFKIFDKKLTLTSSQQQDAKIKYNNVCKTLHNSYYVTKYNGSTKFLFGSYKKKTNIRPMDKMQDVDVLFKIPKETFEKFDNYESNGQSALLQEIRNTLNNTFTTTSKISGWGKVVLVNTVDGTHNIEVLPAYELTDKTFKIPNSENGGSWEIFDPREDINNFQDSNQQVNGLVKIVTRMLKSWKRQNKTLNIISNPQNTDECIANNTMFIVEAHDYDSLIWQVDEGSGFINLTNNTTYSGVNNDTLVITNVDASMDGYIYHCKLINQGGELISDNATLNIPTDNTAPTLVCVGNQTRPASASHTYTTSGTEFDPFSLSDNCNIQSIENNINSSSSLDGYDFPEGTTTVTWVATDYSGNVSTCSFDVIVDTYVGINNLSSNNNSQIYPNPAHNNLQVTMSNEQ